MPGSFFPNGFTTHMFNGELEDSGFGAIAKDVGFYIVVRREVFPSEGTKF